MNKKKSRSLIPRKLKLIPAAAMSVVLLAILSLLGLLNFNPPSISDSSTSDETSESEESDASESTPALVSTELLQSSPSAPESPESTSSDSGPSIALQPLTIVDVLIDGDDYLFAIGMRDETLEREPRTVAEIVDAAANVEGDSAGVKIRIARTFQATAQAENELLSALKEAGMDDDAIDQRRTLIEPSLNDEPQ